MTVAIIETVGKVLNSLADKIFDGIQKTIESQRLAYITVANDIHDSGISLQIEAGRQVRLAIESFKNSYADSLELTVDKVSIEAQKNLATIAQLVEEFLNPKGRALIEISERVEKLILRLPFVDKTPYLRKTTPSFVAFSENSLVIIRFVGHFPKDQATTATFNVGQQTFTPSGDENQLICQVPNSILCAEKVNVAALAEGELKLTWLKSGLITSSPQTNTYKIWIGVLPATPGTFKIIYKQPTTKPETKEFLSNEFFQSSGSKGGNLTILDKEYAVPPEDGWKIVRGSSQLDVIEKRPKNTLYSFVSDDRDRVIYKVTTTHVNHKGDSGQIKFRIKFNQMRDLPIEGEKEEDCELKWGESRVLENGFKKVVFDAFDHRRFEMSGISSDNPFIKIRNQGGKHVLCAVEAGEISFLSSIPASKY